MGNRIKELFEKKKEGILNVYFTAGHPHLEDTVKVAKHLSNNGVDLIELGMPYSDPLADGKTIQESSQTALANGMTLKTLIAQVNEIRSYTEIPMIAMGYFNQMMQYGSENFLRDLSQAGIDGLIIPDTPMYVYKDEYEALFQKYNLTISFLITPETSDERIQLADELSSAFIYVVSKSSITGSADDISDQQRAYFNHINSMQLKSPRLIGFGIHNKATYDVACSYSQGAIIGSAFIRALEKEGSLSEKVSSFLSTVR